MGEILFIRLKTGNYRENPVEMDLLSLTKISGSRKVNGGRVRYTRMNIGVC